MLSSDKNVNLNHDCLGNDFCILFDDQSSYEFKYNVLKTIIFLFNQKISDLLLVAKITKSVCRIDKENKTAIFTYIGI